MQTSLSCKVGVIVAVTPIFLDGGPYAIYFLPHTRRVVAAEWLHNDPFEAADGA